MKALLVEILTEELPALPLLKELENIKPKWYKSLEEHGFASAFEFYYTPRRLVFIHPDFKQSQADFYKESFGPPKALAYTNGRLNNIGESFLKKNQINEKDLCIKEQKGKEHLYVRKLIKGKSINQVLADLIKDFLSSLNLGKKMRWDDGKYEFSRAIRGLCTLYDDELIPCELYGVKSAKKTFVHRNISYEKLSFDSLKEYLALLENNFVILDQAKRKKRILDQFSKLDLNIYEDSELLAEIVAITEYPTAIKGYFDKEFLKIPSEVIISSMREHQRYFASYDKEGKLNNAFVVVSNAVCEDFSRVRTGNERVLLARLSDGAFFYQNDLKTMLNNEGLEKISFLDGLGSLMDKVQRERKIASLLCKKLGFEDEKSVDEAVYYSKADLCSQVVYEFGELQGIMGYYYALHMGLDEKIALAIKEQYLPRGDKMPSSKLQAIVALATKLDSLMGLFSIGKIPSGSKDPFALRRACLGVLKILIFLNESFCIRDFLNSLAFLYKSFDIKLLEDFIAERLFNLYDLNPSFIKAVLASKNQDILHIDRSIKALARLVADDELDLGVFKRLANIAKDPKCELNTKLFTQKSEQALYEAFKSIDFDKNELESLQSLLALKPFIEDFFENVMVNDENIALKNNRHALIYSIYLAFLGFADLKELSIR